MRASNAGLAETTTDARPSRMSLKRGSKGRASVRDSVAALQNDDAAPSSTGLNTRKTRLSVAAASAQDLRRKNGCFLGPGIVVG